MEDDSISDEAIVKPRRGLAEWALPAVTGVAVFLVYLLTLAPTILGGDTGELAAVACSSGVAHPPGYPVFIILAKVFTFIPFGNVGWRINLLSALCDALAAVVLLLAVKKWTRNQWAGLVTAGLFAFSPLTWRYAVTAEVFALNNLIVAMLIYLAVCFAADQRMKHAFLFGLVFGLGLANHLTCIFYAVPLFIWMFVTAKAKLWSIRNLGMVAGCFFIGMLPYLYLPIADSFVPAFSWGHTSTIHGFVTHLLRSEFGSFQLGANNPTSGGYFMLGLGGYVMALPGYAFYVGLVLAAIGIGSFKRHKFTSLAVTLMVAYCFYLVGFHALANLPIDQAFYLRVHSRFWQQANLLIFVWAGLGVATLASMMPDWSWRAKAVPAVSVLIIIGAAAFNFRAEDQHLNTSGVDFGREVLRPLPQNSILWSREDLVTFPIAYLQQCEGYRRDVTVIDRELLRTSWMKRLVDANYPAIKLPGSSLGSRSGGFNIKQLFDANQSNGTQFVNRLEWDPIPDFSWSNAYDLWPFGMVSLVVPKTSPVDPYSYIEESSAALPQLDLTQLNRHPDGSWENEMLKYYWEARLNRANHLISTAISRGNDQRMLEAGAAGLEDMVVRLKIADPRIFKTLGSAYYRLSAFDVSYREKMKATWRRYLELGPSADDPDLIMIRNAVNN